MSDENKSQITGELNNSNYNEEDYLDLLSRTEIDKTETEVLSAGSGETAVLFESDSANDANFENKTETYTADLQSSAEAQVCPPDETAVLADASANIPASTHPSTLAYKHTDAPSEYTDVSSVSEKEKNIFKRISVWFNGLPKKKKIIVSAAVILLTVIIVLLIVGGIFIADKFNRMGDKINEDIVDDMIYDDIDFEEIDGEVGASGFKEALKEWATSGNNSIMSSKNVINVLLVGADSRKGTNSGNTDVMMLVSINKKTKEIKLVSFFRDSYLYIEDQNGDGHYGKLNSAYSIGGPECLMNTIEKNYKINIDNFIMVNFESFKDLIDAMDGVTVDVQKYEADYIQKRFKLKDVPYGEDVTLNGTEALCFCRSRGCDADGDVSRTRRQRQVINAIIDEVEDASFSNLNKYIDTLLPYLYTGYSKSEILTLGMKAYTGKWMNFERSQLQMPPEEARTSGYAGSAWIWVVDYQLSAQILQNELYGKSNITLGDSRRTLIDIYCGVNGSGSYSGGSSSSGSSENSKPEKTTAPAVTSEVSEGVTAVTVPVETTEGATVPDVSETEVSEPVSEAENTETEPVSQEQEPPQDEPQEEPATGSGEPVNEPETQAVTEPAGNEE